MAAFGILIIVAVFLLAPQSIVETLRDPVAVKAIDDDALVLGDGRRVILPGFVKLRRDSPGLGEAIRRGVEIGEDGRVYAQVRVHHWCGNDPIGWHLKRIDLSRLLTYLEEINRIDPQWETFQFGDHGWRAGWDMDFDRWEETGKSMLAWRVEDGGIDEAQRDRSHPL